LVNLPNKIAFEGVSPPPLSIHTPIVTPLGYNYVENREKTINKFLVNF
jgi:hypothetical protein